MRSFLVLRTTCSIQQLRNILISCSEVLEVTYSQDGIVCLCCSKLYRHFSWPISKDEKVILLFLSTKGVGFDFLLFQLVVIYMCAKNRTLASQNSWLYAAQICQISCTEHETTALLFWFFSRVSLWLHLHFCHMVPCSLSCSMSPCPNAALPGWGSTDQLHTHCESINK